MYISVYRIFSRAFMFLKIVFFLGKMRVADRASQESRLIFRDDSRNLITIS